MSVIKAFDQANKIKHEREWDTLYIALDIHGTTMLPNWDGYSTEFYDLALEGLREIVKNPIYKIIIWSCSKEQDRAHYKKLLEDNGIPIYAVNSNPETDDKLDWGDYSKKIYCNILLDDKAGFDPHEDWQKIIDFLKRDENAVQKTISVEGKTFTVTKTTDLEDGSPCVEVTFSDNGVEITQTLGFGKEEIEKQEHCFHNMNIDLIKVLFADFLI